MRCILYSFWIMSFCHSSALAKSKIKTCYRNILDGIAGYSRDVKETKGRRIILKSSDLNNEGEKLAGFIRPTEVNASDIKLFALGQKLTQSIPRTISKRLNKERRSYDVTPLKGVYRNTVTRPSHYVTNKFLGEPLEPTLVVTLPIAIVGGVIVYDYYDQKYKDFLNEDILKSIELHSVDYDAFVANDYRFRLIKKSLKKKELTAKEARIEAYLLMQKINNHIEYLGSSYEEDDLDVALAKLKNHPLFASINAQINTPVSKMDGFDVPESSFGDISNEQAEKLINIQNLKLIAQQMVVDHNSGFSQNEQDPIQNYIYNNEFADALKILKEQKEISDKEYVYYLQEDLQWRSLFEIWDVLGVKKLKSGSANQHLSLNDIRFQIIDEIRSK